MEKEYLENLVKEGLSIRQISAKINKSDGSVKHWLKKYGLKTCKITINTETHRFCPRCETLKHRDNFYTRRGVYGSSVYCKNCTSDQTIERSREFKNKCVEYKGGECIKCGYNKYNGALEFHHTDPNEKDFSISMSKLLKFDNVIKKELDKCILLCSNCHKEEHGYIE